MNKANGTEQTSYLAPVADRLTGLRNRHFAMIDALALLITPVLALVLRTDGQALASFALPLLVYTTYAFALRLAVFWVFGFYARYWRYASIDEVIQLVGGGVFATVVLASGFFGLRIPFMGFCEAWSPLCELPRSIPFIDGLLIITAVIGTRFSVRVAATWLSQRRTGGPVHRVFVMGAGDAGAMIAREMRSNPQLGLEPVGYIDDDMSKHDVRIHSLPVLGSREDIPDLVREYHADEVIIAMPAVPGKTIREIVEICDRADVKTRIMPGIYELLDGKVTVSQLRDVDIEDLLRRDPVKTDTQAVQALLQGKRVLVTGGGGSIGSELCRQIWRCNPAQLVILGHGENSIFDIHNELVGREPGAKASRDGKRVPRSDLRAVIADIRIAERVNTIFNTFRPQIVFHAAAHKHVPLMERNLSEAVTNNILGTRILVDASQRNGVEHFVMISTDKAVNPTSIMGASKRAAELLVHQAAIQSGKPYVAVRFGNVLGSRGSVIHTFRRQIANGGPCHSNPSRDEAFFL